MHDRDANGKPIKRISVGARYPEDRVALLDVVKVRHGKEHRSEVVSMALDRLLATEGLLPEAA